MIEVALFTGVGLLGYILATKYNDEATPARPPPREMFSETAQGPDPDPQNSRVQLTQGPAGHNNMVPFFGSRVTQNVRGNATESKLDSFSGAGNDYYQKREVGTFYDIAPGNGIPFGNPVETDFMQSRMVTGTNMKNVFPIDKTFVAPGLNDGYNNLGKGGYQQFNDLQQFAKPRTTDELRTVNKPKISYDAPVIPGSHYITQPGVQPPVNKNRPDRFQVLTEGKDGTGDLLYLNTTTGAQVAPATFPEQMQKEQQRETTSKEHYGGGGSAFTTANYVRAFTEPFEQFLRLTVGDWVGPGGGAGALPDASYVVDPYLAAYTNPGREASVTTNYAGPGNIALASGEGSAGAVKVNKDEDMLVNTRQFSGYANVITTNAGVEQQGRYQFNQPLDQSMEVRRMEPAILDAFRSNPYTQNLQSVA